jgi:hypothetical protein
LKGRHLEQELLEAKKKWVFECNLYACDAYDSNLGFVTEITNIIKKDAK